MLPTYWGNPYSEIYSVRVSASDEEGGFSANGKGRTQIYALASAYAEIIERIQNQLISGIGGFNKAILIYISSRSGFYYYPDEKPLIKDDFIALSSEILEDLFSTKSSSAHMEYVEYIFKSRQIKGNGGLTSVPFFDMAAKRTVYLPYNLLFTLTGSNGMAAGNTIAEATYQAMCEIYERKAASMIYYENLTPPTIDKVYLLNYPEELAIINEIESKGFELFVKDFSCNMDFPVVGLILRDKETGKYRLNVGSDTSFKVALSRTLTEIYQGMRNEEDIKKLLLEFPDEHSASFFFNNEKTMEYEINLKKFMKNGLGFFPPSLFGTDFSYSFNPSVFNSKSSYEEEVKHLLGLAQRHGYKVYIRDVSFLGFPSVYIYIPQVSLLGRKDLYHKESPSADIILFDDLEILIFPFETFIHDSSKIKQAIKIIEDLNLTSGKIELKELFHLTFKNNSAWDTISVRFFMSLLYFLVKDYGNSILCLKGFISENKLETDDYYRQIISYFELLKDGGAIESVPAEILNDFKSPLSLFKYIGFPHCPDCEVCALKNECLTRINVANVLKINRKFSESIINQNKFSIFS